MKFSVTIPAYKRKFLREAITSILCQTFKNFELIIVDDCSPEDLASVVNEFSDPRIKYFRNSTNCGAEDVVKNWNICLSHCSGDFVICMGDDDMLMPNCLEVYNQLSLEYPQVDIMHARVRLIDENGDLIRIHEERPQLESAFSYITNRLKSRIQYIGDFCFRTSRLKEVGGFFDLPFAWGSDDITTFKCVTPNGIANTNIPTFCYRQSRFTITNSNNEIGKFLAIDKEEIWLKDFVSKQTPQTEIQTEELKTLTENISCGMNNYRYWVVFPSCKKNIFNLLKWFYYRKEYSIPTKVIVKSFKNLFLHK